MKKNVDLLALYCFQNSIKYLIAKGTFQQKKYFLIHSKNLNFDFARMFFACMPKDEYFTHSRFRLDTINFIDVYYNNDFNLN